LKWRETDSSSFSNTFLVYYVVVEKEGLIKLEGCKPDFYPGQEGHRSEGKEIEGNIGPKS